MVGTQQQTFSTHLANSLIAVLEQGIWLIESLGDDVYSDGNAVSSVGVHFRHNLDFVSAFLDGLESGRIDYGARARDERISIERQYALSRMRTALSLLSAADQNAFDCRLEVRSETNAAVWCGSSGLRELEFLLSHTIHHYALIAYKLSARGIDVPENFGVAPSTVEFWNKQKGEAQ